MTAAQAIIEKFLDDPDQVTEAEMETLLRELHESPTLATELKEQLVLNELLGQRYAVDRQGFLAQVEQRIRDYTMGEQQLVEQVNDLRDIAEDELLQWNERNRRSRRRAASWLAAAVLLSGAVGVGAGGYFYAAPQFAYVAEIKSLDGSATVTRDGVRKEVTSGVPFKLRLGDMIQTSAENEVVFSYTDDGTEVQVGRNSIVRFVSPASDGGKRIGLDAGQISAKVTPQRGSANMVFETPIALATVVGTEFILAAEPLQTRLYVTEGTVELERTMGRPGSWNVRENHYGIVTQKTLVGSELAWPSNREGLLFVFESHNQVNFVKDPRTGLYRQSVAEPHDFAGVNHEGAMALTNGYWQAKGIETDLVEACKRSNSFSFEAFVRPANLVQESAEILSLSTSEDSHNFLLSQEGNQLVARIRTSKSPQGVAVPVATLPDELPHHLIVSFQSGRLCAYLDGVKTPKSSDLKIDGDLSNWVPQHILFGDRYVGGADWKGVLEGIAIYNRFIEPAEAKLNSGQYRELVDVRNSEDG